MTALVEQWGPDAAVGAVDGTGNRVIWSDDASTYPLASVSKLITALGCLVAIEEGTLGLDAPAGPPGSTVRHLLAHASGLDFDGATVLAAPGERRIYSNTGFELLAEELEVASGIAWQDYLREAVVEPLGMSHTVIGGSAARSFSGTLSDLIALGSELLAPTLISKSTWVEATTVQFGDLDGVLPGFGTQRPNPWGLGFEIKGAKAPHWTGRLNSARAFGHFGSSGAFLWVDPDLGLSLVALGRRDFGDWALELWPRLADTVIGERFAGGGRRSR